jgi:hypothetical protein
MMPIMSSDGEKVNWVNYKTGERGISFRMQAGNKEASIAIELSHKDPELRQLYLEQFLSLRKLFQESMGEEWTWEAESVDEEGRVTSRIFTSIGEVSIFKKEEWPRLISFFKPRIIALDLFWSQAKYGFELLR